MSEAIADVEALLDLDAVAIKAERAVIIGAAFFSGHELFTGVYCGHRFDQVQEVHVARMGTGGPACQRQLHRARTKDAIEWRDGSLGQAPGWNWRELVWFRTRWC